ncbi:hypothetical protein ACOMHN_059720 [Nucella lapillus]
MTTRVNLKTYIAMGRALSPLLFMLTTEDILKETVSRTGPADLGNGVKSPLKAFMDVTTVLSHQRRRDVHNSKQATRSTCLILDELQTKEI